MMNEWKVYQQMYQQFTQSNSDDASRFKELMDGDIVGRAIEFLTSKPHYTYYPGKQYAVSVVYAYLTSVRYGVDIRELLDDPDLLLSPAYPHVRYSDDSDTYDQIIEFFMGNDDRLSLGWVPYTVDYWERECTEEGIGLLLEGLGSNDQEIDLSINVTHYCNLRCDFCYLTPEQLSDKAKLPLAKLRKTLDEVCGAYNIRHVDLYGGELALLPEQYFKDLVELVKEYKPFDIRLITNLTIVNSIVMHPEVDLYVSYDFTARELEGRVRSNLQTLDRPFHVLTLATDTVVDTGVDEVVEFFNSLPNLMSVEVKPYSDNQSNGKLGSGKGFYDLVSGIIANTARKFEFRNITLLDSTVNGSRNAYSDDHVFITPSGNVAVLDFDLLDREFFLTFENVSDYSTWTGKEKASVGNSEVCRKCRYQGRCLTEHYRSVEPDNGFCSGHKKLIDWYQSNS